MIHDGAVSKCVNMRAVVEYFSQQCLISPTYLCQPSRLAFICLFARVRRMLAFTRELMFISIFFLLSTHRFDGDPLNLTETPEDQVRMLVIEGEKTKIDVSLIFRC